MFFDKKPTSTRTAIAMGIFIGAVLGLMINSPILGMIIGGIIGNNIGKKIQGGEFKKHKKEKIINAPMKKKFPKPGLNAIITLIIIFILIYVFRPWFHGFFMGFYRYPLLVFFVLFAILGAIFFQQRNVNAGSFFVALAVVSMLGLFFHDIILERYIVQDTEYNKIEALPDTTEVRILPKAVARRYLEDSLQKSREKIGGLDIVNIDGKPVWTAPRIPDGFILFFTQKVNGLMIADITKTDRVTRIETQTLEVGEGIGLFDNIYWNLFKKKYFIDIDEIYYIMHEDRIKTVAPVVGYKFKFPVMMPYFKGVFVVDEGGSIQFYTPAETKVAKVFEGNWVYPESLARLYVDSYKFHLGIMNTWFLHEDQIEISDVYGQSNKQPFLMPTEDGLKWIIATEPWGESYGVFKIFLVDALTGKIEMIEMDEEKTLTGPVRVVSYVKKKFPIIDWATASVIEPRPYVIDGNLYWELSITPRDFAGISYTVFVNSMNNEVLAFEDDEGVYAFVTGEKVVQVNITEEESVNEKIRQIEALLEELKVMV
ncbi:hypothetical protein HQ529_04310 [Candidatus Woesearchaeota archaeon]|nr:hypothetical protein [Candidatus Woesearchaeota archaeon]